MQKTAKITIALLLVVGAVVVAIAAGVFNSQKNTGSGLDDFLGYIPADSPFVIVGQTDAEYLEAYDKTLRNTNPEELRPVFELLEGMDDDSPAYALLWLLDDYLKTAASGGYEGLKTRYGIDLEAPFGLYVSGAAPVLRGSLTNAEALHAVLQEAQEATGVTLEESTLGSASLYQVELSEDEGIALGFAIAENSWTLSLLKDGENDEARMVRFARQPVAESLAGSDIIEQLREDYAAADQAMGFLDIEQLTRAMLLPEQSSTGRELREWFPKLRESLDREMDAACRDDYLALAGNVPRLTFGSDSLSVSGDDVEQAMSFLWEIKNQSVVAALPKLHGHIPAYARTTEDKLGAFALGVNVSQLVPVLTEFWNQFTTATFSCPQLQEMQRSVQMTNPAMLGMGTAMFDSVRGVGVALFNIEQSDTTPLGLDGSALITLSSENPAALASMASAYMPGVSGLQIPSDGTAVEIPDPMGLGGNFVAIKGKHLVVYRGEAAREVAEDMSSEPLEATGVSALALNLKQPRELFDIIEPALSHSAAGMGECGRVYDALLSLTKMPFSATYQEQFTQRGWNGQLGFEITTVGPASMSELSGTYALSQLDPYSCNWNEFGTETLEEDGTGGFNGGFVGPDESAPQCDTFRSEFEWSLTGSLMVQTPGSQEFRSSCEEEWETVADVPGVSCEVLAVDDEGFFCSSVEDEHVNLVRYQRQ